MWRRFAIAGVLGFVVVVAVWAFRPWNSVVALPPVDNKTPQAVFSCGAVFGGDSIEPANELARSGVAPPDHACAGRGARRVLAVADLAVGALGLVILIASRQHQASEDE